MQQIAELKQKLKRIGDCFSLEQKGGIFHELGQRQVDRLNNFGSALMNAQGIDHNDSRYNDIRAGTSLSLEIGTLATGVYSLGKGAYYLARAAKMPGHITKVSNVLNTSLSKTTLVDSKSWTNSINPFRGKTFQKIDQLLNTKGFTTKGPDPLHGKGSYFSPATNRKYYLDYAGKTYKGGITELPHVDVHYNMPVNGIEKQRFPLGEYLYELE